jgi:ketol-acid reductoisomerase
MGNRAVEKLSNLPRYHVLACESDPSKAEALEKQGFQVTPVDAAIPVADFVVLAIPDALIGYLARQFVPSMKPGATLVMLDAAAAYINDLPEPRGVTLMLTHPCHPPFFTEQATLEARHDYFGGTAVQDIVVSLVHGSESQFQEATELCKAMFAPVKTAHRVTPEQAALLEPAMSEIVVAMAACLMKDSLDVALEKGVPPEAARAFIAGHARIAMAIAFGAEKSPFSDAAKIAIQWGTREIIRPDWRKVFEPHVLRDAIHAMLRTNNN